MYSCQNSTFISMMIIVFPVYGRNLHRYFSSRGPWHNMAMASLKESTRTWPVRWLQNKRGTKTPQSKVIMKVEVLLATHLRFNLVCYCSRFMGYLIRKKVLYAIKSWVQRYLQGILWHCHAFKSNIQRWKGKECKKSQIIATSIVNGQSDFGAFV